MNNREQILTEGNNSRTIPAPKPPLPFLEERGDSPRNIPAPKPPKTN